MVNPRGWIKWYLFLPGFLLFMAVVVVPLGFSYVIMFFRWNLLDPYDRTPVFVGLSNFAQVIFRTPDFWAAWFRTLEYVAIVIPAEFGLGLLIAVALNRKLRFERVVRTLIFIPLAMAPIVIGTEWRIMFNQIYGVIGYVISLLRLPPVCFVACPSTALVAAGVVDIWEWTPFVAGVLLAALASLPREPMEAAMMDGASRVRSFLGITLPMMKNYIIIVVVLRLMDAIKTYDLLYTLTGFGPGTSTELVTYEISATGFQSFQVGLAAAQSFFTAMIASAIIYVFIRSVNASRRRSPR